MCSLLVSLPLARASRPRSDRSEESEEADDEYARHESPQASRRTSRRQAAPQGFVVVTLTVTFVPPRSPSTVMT